MVVMQTQWIPTKRRGPIAAEFSSPGPACVGRLPPLLGLEHHDFTRIRGPGYTFGLKSHEWKGEIGPGPAAYTPNPLIRETPPAYTIVGRPRGMMPFTTPAPGRYSPEKCVHTYMPNSPKYTMGIRTQEKLTDYTPSPNAYNIPSILTRTITSGKNTNPSYTFPGRSRTDQDFNKGPGPGAYKITETSIYKTKPPAFTMTPRSMFPRERNLVPGPGAHSPEKFADKFNPSYTFGIRHSDYIAPLIVDPVEIC